MRNLLTGLIFFLVVSSTVISFIHLSVHIMRNVKSCESCVVSYNDSEIFIVLKTNKEDIIRNAFTVFGLELSLCKIKVFYINIYDIGLHHCEAAWNDIGLHYCETTWNDISLHHCEEGINATVHHRDYTTHCTTQRLWGIFFEVMHSLPFVLKFNFCRIWVFNVNIFATVHKMILVCTIVKKESMLQCTTGTMLHITAHRDSEESFDWLNFFLLQKLSTMSSSGISFILLSVRILINKGIVRNMLWW